MKNFIICLILPLSVFQDVALQHFGLGVFGGSLAILPLVVLALISFFDVIKRGKIRVFKNNLVIVYIFFFLCINAYFVHENNYVAFGENLIIKSLKMTVIYGASIYCFSLFRSNNIQNVGFWIKISLFLAVMGVVSDLIFHEALIGNWWLHYSLNESAFYTGGFDDRLKGFSLESSTLGLTLMVLGLLSSAYSNNSYSRYFYIFFSVVLCYFSQSKAALPVILGSVIVSLLWANNISKYTKFFTLVTFSGLVFYLGGFFKEILSDILLQNFISDIENSTSFSTRSSLFLASFINVLSYPLGVGFSGYMQAITEGLINASALISSLTGFDLNMREIYTITYGNSDYAISAKTVLSEGLFIFGIPFLIAWVWLHFKLLRSLANQKHLLALATILSLGVALTFYNNGQNLYFIAAAYGLIVRGERREA